jgi:hypothetical protein
MSDDAPSEEETVIVSLSRYRSLCESERKLIELEAMGVDNWSGYDDIDWTYVHTGKRE